jgi:hypothetical protein
MATICKDIQERIEEQVWEPVDDWVKRTEERCEEYDWWNPVGWFCWLVTIVVKIIRWILVPVVTFVFRTVCEVVNFLLNLVAAIFNIALAVPLLGPLIKTIIRAYVTGLSYVGGLIDGFARFIGIRTTKHLRVHVIPLCEGDIPLAFEAHLVPVMRETERILYDRAQIRVHTTFHEPVRNPPENALRIRTGFGFRVDEAWLMGSWHQIQTVKLFESNLWSLIAVGRPIVVYVVREVEDGPDAPIGISGGLITDWVAVERDFVVSRVVRNDTTGMAATPLSPYPPIVASTSAATSVDNIKYWSLGGRFAVAHEICHTLGLSGHANSGPGDLMAESGQGDALSPFQVGIIRNSAPVTFL